MGTTRGLDVAGLKALSTMPVPLQRADRILCDQCLDALRGGTDHVPGLNRVATLVCPLRSISVSDVGRTRNTGRGESVRKSTAAFDIAPVHIATGLTIEARNANCPEPPGRNGILVFTDLYGEGTAFIRGQPESCSSAVAPARRNIQVRFLRGTFLPSEYLSYVELEL